MNRKRLRTSLCVWEKDQTMQQPAKRGESATLQNWDWLICTNRLLNAHCHPSLPLQMPLWGQNAGRTPREKDETALTGEFTLGNTNAAQKPTQSVKTDVMCHTEFFRAQKKSGCCMSALLVAHIQPRSRLIRWSTSRIFGECVARCEIALGWHVAENRRENVKEKQAMLTSAVDAWCCVLWLPDEFPVPSLFY